MTIACWDIGPIDGNGTLCIDAGLMLGRVRDYCLHFRGVRCETRTGTGTETTRVSKFVYQVGWDWDGCEEAAAGSALSSRFIFYS